MNPYISKKIELLNQVTLDSLLETDDTNIIKHFVECGLKILGADFGFAWWKVDKNDMHTLVYKSAGVPYEPNLPRERGGNFKAEKYEKPVFVENVIKENYEPEYDVSSYMKSYVIIPVLYKNQIYGSFVLCFKEKNIFTDEDRGLAKSLGTTTAQTITIHDLIKKESEARKDAHESKVLKELLDGEKLKTEFIANATHELRTPLAIIKGNIDLALLPKTKKSKSAVAVLKAIDSEIKHLSGILSDLTLITSSKVNLKHRMIFEEIDIPSLIIKLAERFKTMANQRNISINIKKMPKVTIYGDGVYLEKMMANLVKNSIMYGKQNGNNLIGLKKSKDSIVISVTDDGIGISKEDLPHIFERFYRVDKSHSGDNNSTGLGLAIVKWVAEIHGGTVGVKSTLGKGSVFNVTLPLKAAK